MVAEGYAISIHALLAESDTTFSGTVHRKEISIHALLAESDSNNSSNELVCTVFLSTLSLRRATYDTYAKVLRVNFSIHALLAESDTTCRMPTSNCRFFYPRSPCGERLYRFCTASIAENFSIHALLAESDRLFCFIGALPAIFLSTLSLRRATRSC